MLCCVQRSQSLPRSCVYSHCASLSSLLQDLVASFGGRYFTHIRIEAYGLNLPADYLGRLGQQMSPTKMKQMLTTHMELGTRRNNME